mmetsp:Transcript_15751/g.49309  ORF Transcript_15751/g.49309 Transcript_15751/m.49309 type:complete len:255 (+) Transcript_15751:3240-4004(+)
MARLMQLKETVNNSSSSASRCRAHSSSDTRSKMSSRFKPPTNPSGWSSSRTRRRPRTRIAASPGVTITRKRNGIVSQAKGSTPPKNSSEGRPGAPYSGPSVYVCAPWSSAVVTYAFCDLSSSSAAAYLAMSHSSISPRTVSVPLMVCWTRRVNLLCTSGIVTFLELPSSKLAIGKTTSPIGSSLASLSQSHISMRISSSRLSSGIAYLAFHTGFSVRSIRRVSHLWPPTLMTQYGSEVPPTSIASKSSAPTIVR